MDSKKEIINRKQLNIKYVDYPCFKSFNEQTNENYIRFYEDHIKLLNELKSELIEIRNYTKIEECTYNNRQKGCINRLYKEDAGWSEENEKFRQRLYELTDFIFYSDELEYADECLTIKEIDEILKMINYLLKLAMKRYNYWVQY